MTVKSKLTIGEVAGNSKSDERQPFAMFGE